MAAPLHVADSQQSSLLYLLLFIDNMATDAMVTIN